MLAHMVARADDVPRDARLIDFCKMLEMLTTVLGNLSNKEAMFFDELRPLPGTRGQAEIGLRLALKEDLLLRTTC